MFILRRFLAVGCSALLVLLASVAASSGAIHLKKGALPSLGKQPSPSIFGIDTTELDASGARFRKDFPSARGLGARWDRAGLGAATGTGNFRIPDSLVTQARKHHMGVVLTFGGVASACSLRPRPSNVSACPPTTSGDLRAYQSYVRRVLVRYRNVVTYYESWAEPNRATSWSPAPNPGAYAALLEAEYAVLQSVNKQYHRHLRLLFGSPVEFFLATTGSTVGVLPFTQQVLDDLHGSKPFDAIALHAYRLPTVGPSAAERDHVDGIPVAAGASGPFPSQGCNSSPQCSMTWSGELSAYEQEFTNHGDGQPPLWLTQFGWPGAAQAGVPDVNSEATQAQFLQEAYDDLLALPFVNAAIWFNVRDYQPGFVSGSPAYFYHSGLLAFGFSQKPAAKAFASLAASHPGR